MSCHLLSGDWSDGIGTLYPRNDVPTHHCPRYPEQVTRVGPGTPPPDGGDLRSAGRRPGGSGLVDRFGRPATDLRVSLTDRCNLRCTYCVPPEGMPPIPDDRLLDDDEVIRLITIAVRDLGIDEVRFTGGEPLLRRGLERIIAATVALRTADGEAPATALTTNGLGLDHRAASLSAAGLRRVNVSLDTLDRARYVRITRRDRWDDVVAGLAAAQAAGLAPLKLNAVLLDGVNDDEVVPLVRWALARGYQPRFIEHMPLGPHGSWERSRLVTAAEVLSALHAKFTLAPTHPAARGTAPAETWLVTGGATTPDGACGTVGIVASVTRPFCGGCDRVRLTADGHLRNCLFARDETDLRSLLRGGADDDEIADAWRASVWCKKAGHGSDDQSLLRPDRPMSAIGG
jgi:cyclic pyranopterin phosphate synthase